MDVSKVDDINYALKSMSISRYPKMQNATTDPEDRLSPFFAPSCVGKLIEKYNIKKATLVNETMSESDTIDRGLNPSEDDPRPDEPIPVPAFFNLTPRATPRSPHAVVEEEFRRNPWAMLIATIFLTKTTARQARPVMRAFFEAFPTPYHVIATDPSYLEQYFDSLGMRKRAHMIWKMSYQFVSANWRRASDLCGVGKYGEDAYRIFCLGHMDLDPSDRYLRLYLDWLRNDTDHMEALLREHSENHLEDISLKYYSITLR